MMHATHLKLVCALLASSLAVHEVAADCNKSSLDDIKKSDGGWDDIYVLQEYNWADYVTWAGCGTAHLIPLGQTISYICANEIVKRISQPLNNYLPAGRSTTTQLVDAIAAGSTILGGEYEGKVGLTAFQCETRNCKPVCTVNGIPYFGDCGRCGSYAIPEPNHLGIYLVRRKPRTNNERTDGTPAPGTYVGEIKIHITSTKEKDWRCAAIYPLVFAPPPGDTAHCQNQHGKAMSVGDMCVSKWSDMYSNGGTITLDPIYKPNTKIMINCHPEFKDAYVMYGTGAAALTTHDNAPCPVVGQNFCWSWFQVTSGAGHIVCTVGDGTWSCNMLSS